MYYFTELSKIITWKFSIIIWIEIKTVIHYAGFLQIIACITSLLITDQSLKSFLRIGF